jgi:predicted DNA-binding protein with PD1-like motif
MRSKILNPREPRSYALVLDTGEEPVGVLTRFAADNDLTAASFTAIGAFNEVVLGYFDWERKDYDRIPIREQVEVLALVGDIAIADGVPKVHAHVVVGKKDASAHGGHLLEARVRPTLEVVITESPAYLVRWPDPESGLALIRI